MIEIFVFILLAGLSGGGAYFHFKLNRQGKSVDSYERAVAASFSARSHRLIAEGVRIDQMPYTFQKHEEYNAWVAKLYEYMDDFEEEVAASLPKGGEFNAYAGIRLVQTPATIMLSKATQKTD